MSAAVRGAERTLWVLGLDPEVQFSALVDLDPDTPSWVSSILIPGPRSRLVLALRHSNRPVITFPFWLSKGFGKGLYKTMRPQ
jgi:hypothetical protein